MGKSLQHIYKTIFFLVIILLFGCSTLPLEKSIEITRQSGVEKTFDYPYKKVFYAAEDAIKSFGVVYPWEIKESDFDKGYIHADYSYRPAIIIVEKIDENKTMVKVQKFGVLCFDYQKFFKEVERYASRRE